MATKKAPAKTTAAPVAKKTVSAPAKKTVATKKMTKAELVRLVTEKMDIPTKQSAAFFDLLAETAIQETKLHSEGQHAETEQAIEAAIHELKEEAVFEAVGPFLDQTPRSFFPRKGWSVGIVEAIIQEPRPKGSTPRLGRY